MRLNRRFYVYIMTNGPKAAILYVGVTGDLRHRVWQHKNAAASGFTTRYNLTRLAYFECFVYPDAAIRREKKIKSWRRTKKLQLIESINPRWEDLARDWQDMYKPSTAVESGDPSLRLKNGSARDDAIPLRIQKMRPTSHLTAVRSDSGMRPGSRSPRRPFARG